MKKKIIISVVFIGFVLALTANSWAQRESAGKRRGDRSGHFQKWDKPAIHKFDRVRLRTDHIRSHRYGPAKGFKHKFHKRYFYRAPHRFAPKFRFWRHRHPGVNHITNYYSATESYAVPEEAFQAYASVSDGGFSVSVGLSKTD
jgi:hypothetical protein